MLHTIRRSASWMILVCLVVMALTLTACGGGNDTKTTDTMNNTNTTPVATTAATSAPIASVNIKETKAEGMGDAYICDPTKLTVNKGDSVTFTNQTDETQDFGMGQSDAQKAGVDLLLKLNQSATITFNTTGTFTLTSGKNATITVTVQ